MGWESDRVDGMPPIRHCELSIQGELTSESAESGCPQSEQAQTGWFPDEKSYRRPRRPEFIFDKFKLYNIKLLLTNIKNSKYYKY